MGEEAPEGTPKLDGVGWGLRGCYGIKTTEGVVVDQLGWRPSWGMRPMGTSQSLEIAVQTVWSIYWNYSLSINTKNGIYPYPLLVAIKQLLSWIIFINYCICILTGSPG